MRKNKKIEPVSNRMSKLIWHLKGIKKLYEDDPKLLDRFTIIEANDELGQEIQKHGSVIATIRGQLGYSQKEFVERLAHQGKSVTIQTLSRWERGESVPSSNQHIKILPDSKEFTSVVGKLEKRIRGPRKMYNDFFTALTRPADITEKIHRQSSKLSEQDLSEVLQLNEARIAQAKEYLQLYDFYHLYDKPSIDYHIKTRTIPELSPTEKLSIASLKEFIKNQIDLYENHRAHYHIALTNTSLAYNFGILETEGQGPKAAWIEARESFDKEGLVYGMSIEGGELINELRDRFQSLWEKAKERDEKAIKWFRSLIK